MAVKNLLLDKKTPAVVSLNSVESSGERNGYVAVEGLAFGGERLSPLESVETDIKLAVFKT